MEFTSKERRFNVISEKDGAGHLVGQTVYLEIVGLMQGLRHIYLRVYRKDELKQGAKHRSGARPGKY